MKYRFFQPYAGSKYEEGLKDKRVLIVGASFYCSEVGCLFYEKCTDVKRKDSSLYDSSCPIYIYSEKQLHKEPTYVVSELPTTYRRFSSSLSKTIGVGTTETVWDYLAFTNYVQFFLPASGNGYRQTLQSDLSQRDFEAFKEIVIELKPNIVIIWGCVINRPLVKDNPYLAEKTELADTGGYLCSMNLPELAHPVVILNPYHPSSTHWSSSLDKFEAYLSSIL